MRFAVLVLLVVFGNVPNNTPTPLPIPIEEREWFPGSAEGGRYALEFNYASAETSDRVWLMLKELRVEVVVLPGERKPEFLWLSEKRIPLVLYVAFGKKTLSEHGGRAVLEKDYFAQRQVSTTKEEIDIWRKHGFAPGVVFTAKVRVMSGQD